MNLNCLPAINILDNGFRFASIYQSVLIALHSFEIIYLIYKWVSLRRKFNVILNLKNFKNMEVCYAETDPRR